MENIWAEMRYVIAFRGFQPLQKREKGTKGFVSFLCHQSHPINRDIFLLAYFRNLNTTSTHRKGKVAMSCCHPGGVGSVHGTRPGMPSRHRHSARHTRSEYSLVAAQVKLAFGSILGPRPDFNLERVAQRGIVGPLQCRISRSSRPPVKQQPDGHVPPAGDDDAAKVCSLALLTSGTAPALIARHLY